MDSAKSALKGDIIQTGISTLMDKLFSVKDTYNIEDKQLQELFAPKGNTLVKKDWWQIYSKPIEICHSIFKYYTEVFDEKERTALDIDITFNVQAHYFFFNSKTWTGEFSSDQELKKALKHSFSKDSITQRVYGLVEQYCKSKESRDQGFFHLSTIEEKEVGARFIFKLIQSIAHCAIWRENPKEQIKAYQKSKQFLTMIQAISRLCAPGSHFTMLTRSIERAIDHEISALSQIDKYYIKEWLRKMRENLENITGQTLLLVHSYVQLTDELPHDLGVRISFLGEEWKSIFYGDDQRKIHITKKRKQEILERKQQLLEKKEAVRTLEEKGFFEDYQDFSSACNDYTANQLLRELFFDYKAIENETRRSEILPEWILAMYNTSLDDHIFLQLWKNLSQALKDEETSRKEYLFRVFKSHVLHPDLIIKMLQEVENGVAPPMVDKEYLKKLLDRSVGIHLDTNKDSKEKNTPKEVFTIFKITCHPDFATTYHLSHSQLESAANNCYQALCNLEIITTRLSLLRWSISILCEQESLIGQLGMIVNAGDLLKQLASLMTDYLERFNKELSKIDQSGYARKIDEAVQNKGSENDLVNWNTKLKLTRQTVTNNIQDSIKYCRKLIKQLPNYISEEKAMRVAKKIEHQSQFISLILKEMKDDLREDWEVVEKYKRKNQEYLHYLLEGLRKPVNVNKEKNILEVKQLLSTLSPSNQETYVKDLLELLKPFNISHTATSENNLYDSKISTQDLCEQFVSGHVEKIPISSNYEPSKFLENSEAKNFFQLKKKYKNDKDWKEALQKVFKEYWSILINADKYKLAHSILIYRIAKFSVFREKIYLKCNNNCMQFQELSAVLDKEIKFLSEIAGELEDPIKKVLINSIESLSQFKAYINYEMVRISVQTSKKKNIYSITENLSPIDEKWREKLSILPENSNQSSDDPSPIVFTHSSSQQLIFPQRHKVKIIQFVDATRLRIESEKNVSLTKTYHSLLFLWEELVKCGGESFHELSPSEEKLKAKILNIHEILLEKPKTELFSNLQKLTLKEIPAEDYFTCLINSDLLILNSKLKENNIIKFVKEILPEYLKGLKTSQLFKISHTVNDIEPLKL